MGISNFFIVIPQIVVAILLSGVMDHFPQVNRLTAVLCGGVCMLVAGILTLFEDMPPTLTPPESTITRE